MEPVKSNRGFASMDRARQREIASKGGHGVPPEKRSFSKNRQLAANGNDIAANFGMRPELDVAEYGHGVAVDFAIDVHITENRDGAVAQRPGNMR